jgi:hypothetical protein
VSGAVRQLLQVSFTTRERACSGAQLFGDDTPVGRRLGEAADFFAFISADLDVMIKNWRPDHPAKD